MNLGVEFHFLTARTQADDWDTDAIFDLSKRVQQDSISVYSSDRNEGAIIGPRADRWGAFEYSSFHRYDLEAESKVQEAKRLAAIAARPDPTSETLMEFALKVFTIEELRALDFRPRDHFFVKNLRQLLGQVRVLRWEVANNKDRLDTYGITKASTIFVPDDGY